MRKLALAALTAVLLVPVAATAQTTERIGIGYSYLSDGNCAVSQRTMVGEYERTSDVLVLRGRVRAEPAGGDCRVDSNTYAVRIARYFSLSHVDVSVEFAASEQTTAAPYVLTDGHGSVLPRADGGALFGTTLPAGASQTVVGAIGLSRTTHGVRMGAAFNLAPIDWALHAPGRTVRLTLDTEHRGVYVETAIDVGASHFGSLSTGYRHSLAETNLDVGIGSTLTWGLAAIDNGAPMMQDIAGAMFLRDGPPQGHSAVFEVTLGYRIQ